MKEPIPELDILQPLFGNKDQIYNLAWDPNGRFLASSSADGTIRTWNTKRGKSTQTIYHHAFDTSWAPDGKTLAIRPMGKSPIGLYDTHEGN